MHLSQLVTLGHNAFGQGLTAKGSALNGAIRLTNGHDVNRARKMRRHVEGKPPDGHDSRQHCAQHGALQAKEVLSAVSSLD